MIEDNQSSSQMPITNDASSHDISEKLQESIKTNEQASQEVSEKPQGSPKIEEV